MFKWLPCFALLYHKSGNACCNHFFLQKNIGHALPCGSSSSHALNYSLSPTCGTSSIGVHQPCTKLLRSRVTVDYPDRSAAVMPNEPLNHKPKRRKERELLDQSRGCKTGPWTESTPLMHSHFLLWERRTMAEAGRGFLEEMRNKMREKRGLGREEAEREE